MTRTLLPAHERASQIRTAAAKVFAQKGYDRTTIDEVAAEAGITKLIVYRHFGSKRELYLAVLDHAGTILAATPQPDAQVTQSDPLRAAALSLEEYLKAAAADPDSFRLLVDHALKEPDVAGHARAILDAGLPAVAEYLPVSDEMRRRWGSVVIASTVDTAVLAWLDQPAESRMPLEDAAARIAGMLAGIAQALL